ncbi:DUF3261 domain-containing protein [Pseudoxanthomonas wuyuanensis]
MRQLTSLLLACLLLAACAHQRPQAPLQSLPPLRLAPAALGQTISVQQRLHFSFAEQQRELDALLEVDAHEVRLLVLALGQSGVRLSWDGHQLQQQRAAWLPPAVRGERVLDDLQFVRWPVEAIRAALPEGWQLQQSPGVRKLLHDGTVWLVATELSPQRVRLENLAEGYRLEIESAGGETP